MSGLGWGGAHLLMVLAAWWTCAVQDTVENMQAEGLGWRVHFPGTSCFTPWETNDDEGGLQSHCCKERCPPPPGGGDEAQVLFL